MLFCGKFPAVFHLCARLWLMLLQHLLPGGLLPEATPGLQQGERSRMGSLWELELQYLNTHNTAFPFHQPHGKTPGFCMSKGAHG